MTRRHGGRAAFVVRVLAQDGGSATPVGTGFLVGDDRILTCAHVVNLALGRPATAAEPPDAPVEVEFPALGNGVGAPVRVCRVERWVRPPTRGTAGGDIAGLRIVNEPVPERARVARLPEDADDPRDVRVELYGTPADPARPEGVWTSASVRGLVGGGMLQLAGDPNGVPLQAGFSGSPLVRAGVDDEHDWVVGMLVATARHDGQAVPVARLLDAWPALAGIPPQPYRGLEPFTSDDEEVFVGREADVENLVRLVDRSTLTVVTGPSGIGKSSLVEAGFIPRWRRRGRIWVRLRSSGTGTDPLTRLLGHLAAALREDLGELRPADLREGAATVIGERATALGQQVMIHLDQFEQVLDAVPAEGLAQLTRALFPDPATTDEDLACRVVVSLRADFLPALLELPGLGPRLQDRLLTLSPLNEAALQRVVTEPARRRRVEFEEGLAAEIAADAGATAGSLPLLQFTLAQLWPRQRERTLTFDDYRAIGGVTGAVSGFAEQWFSSLGEDQQRRAERVLLALVRTRGGARAAIGRAVPLARSDDARPIVAMLSGRQPRLLTVDAREGDEAEVRLAHEAVIRAWPRYRDLVDRDAEYQRWLAAAEDRVADGELLPATRLEPPEGYVAGREADLPPEIVDLVRRSRAALDRGRRVRRAVEVVLAVLVLAALVLTVIVGVENRRLSSALDTANARSLAELAQSRLGTDPASGAELALAAYRADPTEPTARSALGQAYTVYRSTISVVRLPGGSGGFDLDPDTGVAAVATPSGELVVDGMDTPSPRYTPVPNAGPATTALVAGHGRWVVLVEPGGLVRIWDRQSPEPPRQLPDPRSHGALTPDRAHLISTVPVPTGTDVRLDDLASGASSSLVHLPDTNVVGVSQTLDPRRIIVRTGSLTDPPAQPTARLTLRDTLTGAVLATLDPTAAVALDGAETVRCEASPSPDVGLDALVVADAATGALRFRTTAEGHGCGPYPLLTADGRSVAWFAKQGVPNASDLLTFVDLVSGRRSSASIPSAASPERITLAPSTTIVSTDSIGVRGDHAFIADGGTLDELALSGSPQWRDRHDGPNTVDDALATGDINVDVAVTASTIRVLRHDDGAVLGQLVRQPADITQTVFGGAGPIEGGLPDGTVMVADAAGSPPAVRDYALPSLAPLGQYDLAAAGAAGHPGPSLAGGDVTAARRGDTVAILRGGVLSWWSAATHLPAAPPVTVAADPAGADELQSNNPRLVLQPGADHLVALVDHQSVSLWRPGASRPLVVASAVAISTGVYLSDRALTTIEPSGSLVTHDPHTGSVVGSPVSVPATTGEFLGEDEEGRLITADADTSTLAFWDTNTGAAGQIDLPASITIGLTPHPAIGDHWTADTYGDLVPLATTASRWQATLCHVESRPLTPQERAAVPGSVDPSDPCP